MLNRRRRRKNTKNNMNDVDANYYVDATFKDIVTY